MNSYLVLFGPTFSLKGVFFSFPNLVASISYSSKGWEGQGIDPWDVMLDQSSTNPATPQSSDNMLIISIKPETPMSPIYTVEAKRSEGVKSVGAKQKPRDRKLKGNHCQLKYLGTSHPTMLAIANSVVQICASPKFKMPVWGVNIPGKGQQAALYQLCLL